MGINMKYTREVISRYDRETIRVYQAYNQCIAADVKCNTMKKKAGCL